MKGLVVGLLAVAVFVLDSVARADGGRTVQVAVAKKEAGRRKVDKAVLLVCRDWEFLSSGSLSQSLSPPVADAKKLFLFPNDKENGQLSRNGGFTGEVSRIANGRLEKERTNRTFA